MDAVIALGAVFLGWLLGFGQQAWRDRREAQFATRLLIHELGINKAELESRAGSLEWAPYRPVNHQIWETYGVSVLRVIPLAGMFAIHLAQMSIDHADELSKLIVAFRERAKPAKSEQAKKAAEEILTQMEDKAKSAVAEVTDRVDKTIGLIIVPAHEPLIRFLIRRSREAATRFWRHLPVAHAAHL